MMGTEPRELPPTNNRAQRESVSGVHPSGLRERFDMVLGRYGVGLVASNEKIQQMLDDLERAVTAYLASVSEGETSDTATILELAKHADLSCEKLVFDWCGECGSCNLARFLTSLAARRVRLAPKDGES